MITIGNCLCSEVLRSVLSFKYHASWTLKHRNSNQMIFDPWTALSLTITEYYSSEKQALEVHHCWHLLSIVDPQCRCAGNKRLFRSINYYLVYAIYAQVSTKKENILCIKWVLLRLRHETSKIFLFSASFFGWLVEWIDCLLLLWQGSELKVSELVNIKRIMQHLKHFFSFRPWQALDKNMQLYWWITIMRWGTSTLPRPNSTCCIISTINLHLRSCYIPTVGLVAGLDGGRQRECTWQLQGLRQENAQASFFSFNSKISAGILQVCSYSGMGLGPLWHNLPGKKLGKGSGFLRKVCSWFIFLMAGDFEGRLERDPELPWSCLGSSLPRRDKIHPREVSGRKRVLRVTQPASVEALPGPKK